MWNSREEELANTSGKYKQNERETSRNRNPYIRPIVTETKLGENHDTSRFLPKTVEYKVYRYEKRSDCGGVLMALWEYHNQNEVYNDNTGVVRWVEITLMNLNKIYIGGCYYQPDCCDNELVQLETNCKMF